MINSPSVAEILNGVVHEMSTSLKEGLNDPVKAAQIDTIIDVLSAAATRVKIQSTIIDDEVEAILRVGNEFISSGQATAELTTKVNAYDAAASADERYEIVSQILSLMSDVGQSAGEKLYQDVRALIQQRLENEAALIGGGFEAAGRS